MVKASELKNRIEILSEGSFGHPALVRIDQQEYCAFDHDPNTIPILEETAQQLLLKELPHQIAFTPCKQIQALDLLHGDPDADFDIPISPSRFEGIAPFRIYHLGNGRAGMIISWHCTKGFWSNESGYRWILEKARTTVAARKKSLSNVRFHRFIDHGYVAGLEFATTLKSSSVETVIQSAYKLSQAIHSAIEAAVKPKTHGNWNETAFVRNTFIPLLKNLGFQNVVFHHGPREFGRDVLFSRQTEFGIPEYWAAQVKLGNVSGKSNSYIDQIVNQAQEAFKIPLLDIRSKSKYWISKFLVVITGRYTENAVEKICQKIESHSQRNNILFLDGDKIQELIQNSGQKKRPRNSSLLHQSTH